MEKCFKALIPLNQVELSYRDGLVYGESTGIDPQFGFDGKFIANRLPAYLIPLFLVIFLIFLILVKKRFPGSQYELSLAVFLFLFAVPTILPRLISLIFTLVALSVFFYLLLQSRTSRPKVSVDDRSLALSQFWLRRKDLFYNIFLILVLVLAFILRIWNLTILDPYTDEYSHLLAAKEYLETGVLNYTRANLVTYLVALFYRIGGALSFYEYLFWGRVPGVIFSGLTVIPLYFITRKLSQPVALISALLWATSPWAIGVARTIREYAYYPFFILIAVLLLIKSLELLFTYKKQHLAKIVLCLIPVAALFGYAFLLDIASTLRICIVIIAGIAAFYIVLHFNRIKEWVRINRVISIVIMILTCLAVAMILHYAYKSGHVSLTGLELSDYWLRIFLVPVAREP